MGEKENIESVFAFLDDIQLLISNWIIQKTSIINFKKGISMMVIRPILCN